MVVSSSWLNVAERFFSDLTTDRIRRDSFRRFPELIDTIDDYTDAQNEDPKPFIWTAEADKILEKVGRVRAALNNSTNSVRHYISAFERLGRWSLPWLVKHPLSG